MIKSEDQLILGELVHGQDKADVYKRELLSRLKEIVLGKLRWKWNDSMESFVNEQGKPIPYCDYGSIAIDHPINYKDALYDQLFMWGDSEVSVVNQKYAVPCSLLHIEFLEEIIKRFLVN